MSSRKEQKGNYNIAIDINPRYLDAFYNRSIAKYYSKDITGAIDDCKKVLELNPNDKKAMKLIAKARQVNN
jgi:tetratricopeptide (TPR) repeat protein